MKKLTLTTALVLSIAAVALTTQRAQGLPAQNESKTFHVDPVHSSILFSIKHLSVSNFYGRFNSMSGSFILGDSDADNMIDVTVKTDSIDTNSEGRDKHLKGPDFFNVKQFPDITFKSKSIKKTGSDMYEALGELTLHGVTKTVTVKITKTGEGSNPRFGHRAGLEATFVIQRKDYDMGYMVGEALDNDVKLIVALEGMTK
jgi:polyisoprenoid-binding protein YceI